MPTAHFGSGEGASLEAVLTERGWKGAVIKPAIGAGSEGVWRTSLARAAAQRRFEADLSERDTLVQRFLPGIESGGRSIVSVDGAYSHAWNDVPPSDDFSAFEPTGVAHEPSESARSAAHSTLAAACRILGYDAWRPRKSGRAVGRMGISEDIEARPSGAGRHRI